MGRRKGSTNCRGEAQPVQPGRGKSADRLSAFMRQLAADNARRVSQGLRPLSYGQYSLQQWAAKSERGA